MCTVVDLCVLHIDLCVLRCRPQCTLEVDWSVPALKSSQSVSRTVQFWVWCTWWNLYGLWHVHFLSFCSCCLLHSHKFYCFYNCTPMSGMVELRCCLIVVIYMCRDTCLHTHIFTHHTPILLYSTLQSDQTRHMALSLGHRCCG